MTTSQYNERRETPEGSAPPLLHPAFLRLEGRKVVLVGGGAVALAKYGALRAAGAEVTVVAPSIRTELRQAGAVIVERAFMPSDLDDAWFVVAAAPPEVNREVAAAATERRLFVNAVDDRAAASAYAAAVVRRGGVTVAVSTDGAAPALAGLVREGLEAVLPEDLAAWSSIARTLRPEWRAAEVPVAKRRPLLLEALNRLYGAGAVPPPDEEGAR